MKLADWHSFYLVGIKGVAMTALAQMLRDMGKHVEGCDVEEEFVTQKILTNLSISIHIGFEHSIPTNTDCVIYTAAHGGISNKIVKSAIDQEMPTFSHAEALGFLFNDKEKRIAVCGVGGKSTVSAMISWVLAKELPTISYSVGVGEIIGLGRNAQWSENSTVFVAEADEYATNPEAVKNGEAIVPRFSYLNPTLLVCTHIRFDHPDVYTNFEHTLQTFHDFFHRIPDPQNIIVSEADAELLPPEISKNAQTVGISTSASLRFQIDFKKTKADNTYATILFKNQEYLLKLAVPGSFNIENAAFAILACVSMGISVEKAISHLESFNSTKRRFEFHGEKLGTLYYDDYAHHPHEIKAAIEALGQWYPEKQKYIAFQPHTFSRTKSLMEDFSTCLAHVPNLLLLDVYASAREVAEGNDTIELLKRSIESKQNSIHDGIQRTVQIIGSITDLAQYFQEKTKNSVVLTLGAGDIYRVHDLLKK